MNQRNHQGLRSHPLTGAALCTLAALSSSGLFAADAPPAEPPKPKWETSAGVSATVTAGNTESIAIGGNVVSQYKAVRDEIRLNADVGYGKARPASDPDADMEKNTDFIRGAAQYNRLFNDRLFAYGRVDATHDDIADVMYRITVGPGAGYYFIKEPKITLSGEVGPGYVFEKVGHDENDYATLRISERFEWKISEGARLWQMAEYLPEVSRWADNFIFNLEVGLAAPISKRIELRVVASDTYDNEPAPGRDENDFKLMAGLNFKIL